MLRLAVALVSRYCIKRLALTSALRIGLTSLALGTLLVFLQHSLYPDSQLFYDLGVYEYEAESCGSRHRLQPVEILHSDVLDYEFTGDEGVFFLFDPFDDRILQQLIQRIDASASLYPRDI